MPPILTLYPSVSLDIQGQCSVSGSNTSTPDGQTFSSALGERVNVCACEGGRHTRQELMENLLQVSTNPISRPLCAFTEEDSL